MILKPLSFYDVEQNSEEWFDMRAGIVTSSSLSKVMANYGKAFGEPAKRLAVDIATGRLTGKPSQSSYSNSSMDRGHEQEPIARAKYEDQTFCEITNGGFYSNGTVGCSPDGHVDDNLIEIKSVLGNIHYQNLCRQNVDPAYKWQCYGSLRFTGKEWLDFVSYSADFPEDKQLFIFRVYSETLSDEFSMIDERLEQFLELVDKTQDNINSLDYMVA